MKIGITGHQGFVGGSVAKALSEQKHQIICLDVYTRSERADKFDSASFPPDLDWVLHFGASTSIVNSCRDPFATYHNNLDSTLVAFKIAHCSQAPFLFMSSYVYGVPQYLPIDEKHPVSCVNPYMGSKVVSETICQQLSETLQLPLTILRGFNIYGNQNRPRRLIPDLLEAIDKGNPIILDDPHPKRDYLYIKDFCELIFKIIGRTPAREAIYNVGYGRSYSNLEVAELAQRLSGGKSPLVVNSNPRPNDIVDCTVDVSLIRSTFSWIPNYPLEKGLEELICRRDEGG